MLRFRMKLDKKGIPAFILILIMMFQHNPSPETAVTIPTLTVIDMAGQEQHLGDDLPATINLIVTGETANIDAVQFLLNEVELRLDDEPPFTFADDSTGWQLPETGEHTITAIPFTNMANEAAAAGEPLTITFAVATDPPSPETEAP